METSQIALYFILFLFYGFLTLETTSHVLQARLKRESDRQSSQNFESDTNYDWLNTLESQIYSGSGEFEAFLANHPKTPVNRGLETVQRNADGSVEEPVVVTAKPYLTGSVEMDDSHSKKPIHSVESFTETLQKGVEIHESQKQEKAEIQIIVLEVPGSTEDYDFSNKNADSTTVSNIDFSLISQDDNVRRILDGILPEPSIIPPITTKQSSSQNEDEIPYLAQGSEVKNVVVLMKNNIHFSIVITATLSIVILVAIVIIVLKSRSSPSTIILIAHTEHDMTNVG